MRRPGGADRTEPDAARPVGCGGFWEIDMRVMLLAAALAALVGGMRSVEARPWYPFEPRPWYPWCARNLAGVDMDCEFMSQQSCLQTVSGVSGFCMPNPAPAPPPPPRRQRRSH
jgi:Protein of unknown function (DUF3551)